MYRCECCEEEFDFPRIRSFSELLDGDGHRAWRKEVTCPYCSGPYFYEVYEDEDKEAAPDDEDIRDGKPNGKTVHTPVV